MKKTMLLVLTLVLICAAAGCGGQNNTANVEDGITTVTWLAPADTQPDFNLVMDALNEKLAEKANVKLDLKLMDGGAYDERMKMNMASGNNFDLCFTGYINQYAQAVEKGGLYCIDDFLSGSVLASSLPDFVWEDSKVGGKIYAVPNYQIMATSMALTVNEELAAKYNLDVEGIKKTTDIEPFLAQVRDGESGIYPFSTFSKRNIIRELDENPYVDYFFDYKGIPCVAAVYDESTDKITVKSALELEDRKAAAYLLHDWFEKGYIRKDVASQTEDGIVSDQKAQKYAVMSMTYKPGIESTIEKQWGYKQVPIQVSPTYVNAGSVRLTMTGIGAKSQNPEAAFKVIELMNTDKELYNLLCFGLEGKHYEKLGENKVRMIDNSGYALGFSAWTFGNQFNAFVMEGQDDDVWEKTVEFNNNAPKSKLLGFIPDTDAIRTEISQCQTVMGEYQVVENGSENPDNYWDEYSMKMKNAGVDKIAAEMQKQIDEFISSKQ